MALDIQGLPEVMVAGSPAARSHGGRGHGGRGHGGREPSSPESRWPRSWWPRSWWPGAQQPGVTVAEVMVAEVMVAGSPAGRGHGSREPSSPGPQGRGHSEPESHGLFSVPHYNSQDPLPLSMESTPISELQTGTPPVLTDEAITPTFSQPLSDKK